MNQETTILTRIIEHKRIEIANRQTVAPLDVVKARAANALPVRDFASALRKENATALIAEVKKASPSRGVLLEDFNHLHLAQTYIANGVSALSVLTDVEFFQGSLTYLEEIRVLQMRDHISVPLLRKDFIIDAYQVYEARASGADALLLIVAALDDSMLHSLLELVHTLGMHALVEVHTADEMLRALEAGAKIVGVNNRDLHTFTTTLETTEQLATHLPDGAHRPVLVSESGIHHAEDVVRLRRSGVDAILVGEALVKAPNIADKVRELAARHEE